MKKITLVLLIAIGITLILIGYNQRKERVTNFQGSNSNITIIDISQEKADYFNYYLIGGMLCISLGVIISITIFNKPKAEGKIDPLERLTNQEKKIVDLISEGKTNKEIANELAVSLSTIKTHTNNIYKKLGANSRAQVLNMLEN